MSLMDFHTLIYCYRKKVSVPFFIERTWYMHGKFSSFFVCHPSIVQTHFVNDENISHTWWNSYAHVYGEGDEKVFFHIFLSYLTIELFQSFQNKKRKYKNNWKNFHLMSMKRENFSFWQQVGVALYNFSACGSKQRGERLHTSKAHSSVVDTMREEKTHFIVQA